MVAIIIYIWVFSDRRFRLAHAYGPWIALGAFLITAAPILQTAARFPGTYNMRLNDVGIVQSGWLEREIGIRGDTAPQILFDQFKRSLLAFNYYSDKTIWYGLKEPLMDPIFGAFFMIGLLYATFRVLVPPGDKRLVPMVAWWWSGVLLGSMLTVNPPSSMRIVTLSVPTAFLMLVGLWLLIKQVRRFLPNTLSTVLLLAALLFFANTSIGLYFRQFTPERIYGGTRARAITALARYLAEEEGTPHIYLAGSPYLYWSFPTVAYLLPDVQGSDLEAEISAPLDPTSFDQPALFAIWPDRQDDLNIIRAAFPDGETLRLTMPTDNSDILILYKVQDLTSH